MAQVGDTNQNFQEVDAEFRVQTNKIYDQWHSGELDFKQAIDTLLQLETQQSSVGQFAHQGVVENVIGMMYGYRANLDMSIRHFARARDMFERANNTEQTIRAVMNLGESYRLKGDFSRARQFFRTAYDQAEALGILTTMAFAASNEGYLLLSLNQFDAAKEMFDKAILHCEHGDFDEKLRLEIASAAQQGLVTYYLRVNDDSAAWQSAVHSLDLAREHGQPYVIALAYRTMGEALTGIGTTPQAPEEIGVPEPQNQDPAATNEMLGDPDMYFQLAIEMFQDIKADGEIARTIYAQGQSLMLRGQKVTAGRKFQQAMLMFTKLGMKDDATKAAQAKMESQAR